MRPIARFITGLGVTLLLAANVGHAQQSSSSSSSSAQDIQAVITGPHDIAVGRTIVLDASLSRASGESPVYQWFVEGRTQPISSTVEAIFTPEVPGTVVFRLVMTVTNENGDKVSAQTTHEVTVYKRKIVLIADPSIGAEKLDIHRQAASTAGVFLRILQPGTSTTSLGGEDRLTQVIAENSAAISGADAIVLWTEGITGLQSLMLAIQNDTEILAGLHNQSIILISNANLNTLARIARGPYTQLKPRRILVTRTEALNPLLTAPTMDEFIAQIEQRDIQYLRIDSTTAGLRPWNLLSSLVNAMLTKGVPSQTVILLLILPVIAMILAFLKQVVGITTFGLYTPSIIALSFLSLGWQLGILFLVFIIATGYVTRAAMRRWRLLYIPKVAIILTVVSITLMILMGVSAYFGITFSRETIFILLIMSTLTESFLNMKTESGLLAAILGIGETIVAALICVFIVQWDMFQSLILAYPELILLTLIVNVILGRWAGLRLVEYFRFREVFKHLQEE